MNLAFHRERLVTEPIPGRPLPDKRKPPQITLARRSFRRLIQTKVADGQIDEVWRILWRDVYPELSVWEKLKFRLGWWADRAAKKVAGGVMKVTGAK